MRLADAEEALIIAVEHDLLNVAVLETSLYKAITAVQAPTGHEDRGAELREELARIEAEVTRLAQAIAGGGEIPALVAAMQDRERRRSRVTAELAAIEREAAARREPPDLGHALDVMREWSAPQSSAHREELSVSCSAR